MGGEGAVWRSVVEVLFLALIGNGYNLLGLNPLYQQVTLGALILLSVGAERLGPTVQRWTRAWRGRHQPNDLQSSSTGVATPSP